MDAFSTTRLSSKGQVVIPEEIRERLGLTVGTEFVVLGENGVGEPTVVLKRIRQPNWAEFDRVVAKARALAKRTGMKRGDITKAIRDVRAGRAPARRGSSR